MQIHYLMGSIILGFIAGMIVNIFADFLPFYFDINKDGRRSSILICSNCKNPVQIRNYFGLKACVNCNQFPAIRNRIVFVLYPILFAFFFLAPPDRYVFGELGLLAVYLGLVTVIDLEHKVIFDVVTVTGLLIVFPIGWHHHGIVSSLLGGVAGFGIMLVLYYLGVLFTKWISRNRKQPIDEVALGAGDIKLSCVLGLLLGWPGITLGLMFAIFAGGLISLLILAIALLKRKYESFMAIPYAPFLVIGTVVLLVWPLN